MYTNNFRGNEKVPYKIVVGKKASNHHFRSHYMLNPNEVKCIAKSEIEAGQKIQGLLTLNKNECRFYFVETKLGKSNVSFNDTKGKHSLNYIKDFYTNAISLNDMLVAAGALMVSSKEESDIDLSPESLQKDTIINLFK